MTQSAEFDQFNLRRFVDAQSESFGIALAELRDGKKRGCWMWYIFPQIHGLGQSEISQRYAISSRLEASAYLSHPVLGPRLRQAAATVISISDVSAATIFGSLDAAKFRSSMTLFAEVDQDEGVFADALRAYFSGEADPLTLAILRLT